MKPWNRKLWGVQFTTGRDEGILIGSLWLLGERSHYPDEPTRALVFQTRRGARAYCKEERAKYEGRQDSCKSWRFRPVRVIETVRPLDETPK